MEIALLGTGAPLHPDRAMTGMIISADGCAPLLVDTCGGLELSRQLNAIGFDRTKILNVVVTHRHLDHAGGIQDLLLARMPLNIYAHPDTHEGIVAMTMGSFPEWKLHPEIVRHEVSAGAVQDIAGFRVQFFKAEHRVPTLAVRIANDGKTFACSADTVPCDEVVACARDVDLFLCDTLCAERDGEGAADTARASMHATARGAATMATSAGASRLVCTHIARFSKPDNILEEAKCHFDEAVKVAQDGECYCI
jgi:ribonuclease BN (tRNA processing enzyme)